MTSFEDPQSLLATVLADAPLGISLIDPALRYAWVNHVLAAAHDMTPEEHEGRRVADIVPDLWPEVEPLLQRALAGETIVNAEFLTHDPGTGLRSRIWLVNFHPIREGDRTVGILALNNDVTQLRTTEGALQQRNDLYAMLAQTNRAVSICDGPEELFRTVCEIAVGVGHFQFAWVGLADGERVRLAASAGDDHGYMEQLESSGHMVTLREGDPHSQGPTGRAILSGVRTVANEIASAVVARPWQAVATEAGLMASAALPISERGRVVGALTVYASTAHFFTPELVDTLGELTPALSLALDRFAARRDEEQRQREVLIRDRALNATTQGIVITDIRAFDQPVIYISPSFERLTGYSSEDMVGRNCRLLQGEGTDREAVAVMRASIAAGRPCTVELLNYRKSGEPFWNSVSLSPIVNGSGTVTHFVGVQTDVSERRRLEAELRQAQKMEAVGQLAGGIAHDFNNVLTAIRGAVSVAGRQLGDEIDATALRQIDAAAEHASTLTRHLLAFGRRQVLRPEACDLNAVVTATLELAGNLLREDVSVEMALAEGLPRVLVDRGQLQQVIINLAINAQEAMPQGGRIAVRTELREIDSEYHRQHIEVEPGTYLMLELSDTGSGMDRQTQDQIFDPFFTTKDEGSGLGLASVYGIVKQSGGHISVVSAPGAGTTFRILLPATESAAAGDDQPSGDAEDLSGTETVLYVEDAEILRAIVPEMLKPFGYRVLTAETAASAVELAEHEHIHLLLSDNVMPGMSGLDLGTQLRQRNPELRVLLTSGYPDPAIVRATAAGAGFEFIQKPFLAGELAARIRHLLDD